MHGEAFALSAVERNERRSSVRHESTSRPSLSSAALLPPVFSLSHHASRRHNDSELVHHGKLIKLCSAKLWSKITSGGFWQPRTFYLHADKTLLNINEHQQLRGKWSLEGAKICPVPKEWAQGSGEKADAQCGFMVQCGPMHHPTRAEKIICFAHSREECEDWKFFLQTVIEHDPRSFETRRLLSAIAELLQMPFKSQLRLEIVDEARLQAMIDASVMRNEPRSLVLEKTLNSLHVQLARFIQEDHEFLQLFRRHFTSTVIKLRAVGDDAEKASVPGFGTKYNSLFPASRHTTHAHTMKAPQNTPHTNITHQLASNVQGGNNGGNGANSPRQYFRTSFSSQGEMIIDILRLDHFLADCGFDLSTQLICDDGVPYVVHESIQLKLAKREHHLQRIASLLGVRSHLLCDCDTVENYKQMAKDGVSPGKFGWIFYDQIFVGLIDNLRNDLYHDKTFGHMLASYCPQRRIRIRPAQNRDNFLGTMKTSCTFSDGVWLIEYSDANFDPHQVGLDLPSRIHIGELPYAAWVTVNKESTNKEHKINRLRTLLNKTNLFYDLELLVNFRAAQEMEIPNIRFGPLFVNTILGQLEKALSVFYSNPLAGFSKVANELNQVFTGHRIVVRPMSDEDLVAEKEPPKDFKALVASLYKISFTPEGGDLLLEYKKSNLVNFECHAVLVDQLNNLLLIDGLPFKEGVAARMSGAAQ